MAPDSEHAREVGGAASAGAAVAGICRAMRDSLPVTGVAVSVMTAGGHRGVVHATDETARSLEDTQFTVGDGPGCDAFASGQAVLVANLLEVSGRWTAFCEVAGDLAVHAVFAFPLHMGAAALGVLTAYRGEPGALSGEQLVRAVRLSDVAAVAVLDLIVGAAAVVAADPAPDISVTAAGFHRAEVYQAAGMVMVQLDVSIEAAMVRLRTHAYATGRPIDDVARDVVERRLRLEADTP